MHRDEVAQLLEFHGGAAARTSFLKCKAPFGNELPDRLALIRMLALLQIGGQAIALRLPADRDGHLDAVSFRHPEYLPRLVAVETADGVGAPAAVQGLQGKLSPGRTGVE